MHKLVEKRMSDTLMILPSKDCTDIRLVRIPDEFEEHEVFRHVTGLIASIEEDNPDYNGMTLPPCWKTMVLNQWTSF